MINISKTVYGYCPEFDEPSHKIEIIYTNPVYINGQLIRKADRAKCENSYDCQYLQEHNGQCPLINKHIDNIKYCYHVHQIINLS